MKIMPILFSGFCAASVSFTACKRSSPLLESLPASQTHVDFANVLPEHPGLGILNYIYYYNGGGVAIGDIDGDGLPDLYFTANSKGGNRLYKNLGNFRFEDITSRAGVAGNCDWCTGATMADVNGDGLLDIYVCAVTHLQGLSGHNELFINNGNGTFTERSAEYGLDFAGYATQAVFFDYDHDGDLDCFILNQSLHPNEHITDTSFRRGVDSLSGERLYRNDGGRFTDVSAAAGLYRSSLCYGLGVAVGDLNNDGWDDIYVGNDFHENDFYYINNGDGTFTESGTAHFRHYSRYSMGNDIADFNNDGQLDLITVDMLPGDEKTLKTYGNGEHLDTYLQKISRNGYQDQYSRNCLQLNNGNGASFSDIGLIAGVSATDWSWSPLFADLDNDGRSDLFISSGIVKRPLDLDFISFFSNLHDPSTYGSGEALQQAMLKKMPDGASHPSVFRGDGHLSFPDVSAAWGLAGLSGYYNGAAYADLDNDGRLDLVVNALNGPAVVLRNNAPFRRWVEISFLGQAIGAKVYVYAGGRMQYQELMLTRGFMSSSEPRLHFGLDTASVIDSIRVVWPDHRWQVIRGVEADRQVRVRHEDAAAAQSGVARPAGAFQDLSATLSPSWRHQENNYLDFKEQYLIPHEESTRGPKMAVADVNGDGLDDLFVCGGAGQPGRLFLQTAQGFVAGDSAAFLANRGSEGVDALFFDANHDGHPDLYVVSGGNEWPDGDPLLADHLYLNDGAGHFHEAALPSLLVNKSCVAAADINGDGYVDLFVGGSTTARQYGLKPQQSWILLNDGKGHFQPSVLFSDPGIVTSAVFADLNRDGRQDLVVAGEWMGVRVFYNQQGVLQESKAAGPSGWWQRLMVADLDGDGLPDILAGNWGLNSKLAAGKDGPLHCYVKDFDGNGTTEQLLTYSIGGSDYPFLGKDQLELALPGLKRSHLRYDELAGKTIRYLFGNQLDDCRQLRADSLASACLLNDGKGGFVYRRLPAELQLSPIFCFAAITNSDGPGAGPGAGHGLGAGAGADAGPGANPGDGHGAGAGAGPGHGDGHGADADAGASHGDGPGAGPGDGPGASAARDAGPHWLAAGNFFGVQPYEGRYDAMNPSIFGFSGGVRYESQLPALFGEWRDARWITARGKRRWLVLARNNGPLAILSYSSMPNRPGGVAR